MRRINSLPEIVRFTTAVVTAGLLSMLPLHDSVRAQDAPGAAIDVQIGSPSGKSVIELGVTHGKYSLDSSGDPQAIGKGKKLLSQLFRYQNQYIDGAGAGVPEPSPGHYDWSKLDARINLIRSTGGIPVITLCGSPPWMKKSSGKGISLAPEHFADFVELVRQVALRYPDVKHYQVWSELKGFWNQDQQRWDYEGYTNLYNSIYDTLKHISPDIQVGGPYVVMGHFYTGSERENKEPSALRGAYGTLMQNSLDVVSYWLAHKHGADFITIDGSLFGRPNSGRTDYPSDWFAATEYFSTVDAWLHSKAPNLPIWWAEWYSAAGNHDEDLSQFDHNRQNALMAMTLLRMMPDVSVALRWKPQGDASLPYDGDQESVWSDTRAAGGGNEFPFAKTVARFLSCFPRGVTLYATKVSSSQIAAFASSKCVALVNETPQPIDRINIEGKSTRLAPYEVAFVERK